MAFVIFTKWFNSDPVHWTLFKSKKRFAVQYVNFVPSTSHQAGVVMSGYTVVLTGNLCDHVLRKTLGLPSLKWPWKVESFFWSLWMLSAHFSVVSFHFWISKSAPSLARLIAAFHVVKWLFVCQCFKKEMWNFLEFCQFLIELTSLVAAN